MNRTGFTLIELVMVIVIIGILAAIALPRFADLTGQAEQAAARGGLGAIRAAAAIKYANQIATTMGTNQSWPTLTDTDFAGGLLPTNEVNDQTAINHLASDGAIPAGTATSASGWWYITGDGSNSGRCGAYSDGTVDASAW